MGKLYINDPVARGCIIGISVPAESVNDVFINRSVAENCKIGIEQRGPETLAARLGLPLDTPPQVIIDAAKALHAAGFTTEVEKQVAVAEMPIWTHLKRAADVASAMKSFIVAADVIASVFN